MLRGASADGRVQAVPSGATPDVTPDVTPDATFDVTFDVTFDATFDATSNAPPDATAGAMPDVSGDAMDDPAGNAPVEPTDIEADANEGEDTADAPVADALRCTPANGSIRPKPSVERSGTPPPARSHLPLAGSRDHEPVAGGIPGARAPVPPVPDASEKRNNFV